MTRQSSRFFVLVLIAALVTVFGISAAEPPVATEAPASSQEAASPETAPAIVADADLPVLSFETPLETALSGAAYECPPGQAYCWKDSQCDAPCGGSGGACVFGCCRCAF